MEDFPPEVLIYIQTVKNFFSKNEGTREYFLSQIDEDIFFRYLGSISKKNFEANGEVMLSEVQFELLRKTLIAMKISEMDENELPIEMSFDYELETIIYVDDRGYEKITTK
jgi:hypothetical protein